MKKTFFIADTHFGDSAIIDYENRPFADVQEMDDTIIRNWNRAVSDGDRVFVVGDFSACGREKTADICRSLNGRKYLIMGNHDTESEQFYISCGFENAVCYPIILDGFWILSHEPMYVNSNMPYANIFGHVHGNPIYTDFSKQSFCVCCERIGYTPAEFEEIKRRMGVK
ncbi:MAG: metallophosphoesterase [Oscillospiraceae bacterium]|nr:metallophosphoesterase [Oscillospiraceae bacterium]